MLLTGVLVPLVTPFTSDGVAALAALESLAHQVLDDGASGLVALGTTAEPGSLTAGERRAVVDVAARVAGERGATLLVGASTRDELAALRARPGVTGALTLVPPFVRPGEDGVVAHLAALAATSPVPLVVYHVPHRTGQQLSAAALRRIAAIDGVVGIKLAVGSVDATAVDLLADPPGRFTLLAGDDVVLGPLLALGAAGGVLASAHLATRAFARLVDAWQPPVDVRAARALGGGLAALSAAVFAEPSPTVLKGVLHAQGRIPSPDVRLPLLPARAGSVTAALSALAALRTVEPHAPAGAPARLQA